MFGVGVGRGSGTGVEVGELRVQIDDAQPGVADAFGCRAQRRLGRFRSATSTRGSISWAGVSSAGPGEAGQVSERLTPTYPSKKSLLSIMDKVRLFTRRTRHRTLADLLCRLNPALRGWCNCCRPSVSSWPDGAHRGRMTESESHRPRNAQRRQPPTHPARPELTHGPVRRAGLAGVSGISGVPTDTPGYPIVELGGIEPPSARWSSTLLRPFPTSQLTAAEPAGRPTPKGPLPGLSPVSAVFHAVSGLSLRSTPTSVAGLWGSGPVRHRWSRFSSTSPEGSGGESELLVVGGSLCVPV